MPEPAPEEEQKPSSPEEAAPQYLDELAVPQRSEEEDDEWDFVFTYTRAQALQDGVLLDVRERARQAGFRLPVAVTAALWQDVAAIPPSYQGIQDVQGRLWDLLWMARLAIQGSNEERSELLYRLILHVGDTTDYSVKLVVGPGDEGEPVLTLMKPGED